MDKIAKDTLETIFSFVEKKSWFNVMLVCKRFLFVGLPIFLAREELDDSLTKREQIVDVQNCLASGSCLLNVDINSSTPEIQLLVCY